MGSKEILKHAFLDAGISTGKVADLMGIDRQVFYNKISRNTMSFKEVSEILSYIGYELTYRLKEL